MVIPDIRIFRIFLAIVWKTLINQDLKILQIIRKHGVTIMRDMSEASPCRTTSGQRFLECFKVRPLCNGNVRPW